MNKPVIACLILSVGCEPTDTPYDSDGDRLSDTEEVSLGTDPMKTDTDQDGVDDLAEVTWTHTDPLLADTDGDGALDGFELEYDLDPLDAASHPYTMGWPMALPEDKAAIVPPFPVAYVVDGETILNIQIYDELSEHFQIYDYTSTAKPNLFVLFRLFSDIPDNNTEFRWANGDTTTSGTGATPATWIRDLAEEGRVNVAMVTSAPASGVPGVDPPSSSDLVEQCYIPTPTFGCFADVTLQLFHHFRQPPTAAWVLVDDRMVVRSITFDPYRREHFDHLESTLAGMLNYTPPPDE
jgi:hypothetical protein